MVPNAARRSARHNPLQFPAPKIICHGVWPVLPPSSPPGLRGLCTLQAARGIPLILRDHTRVRYLHQQSHLKPNQTQRPDLILHSHYTRRTRGQTQANPLNRAHLCEQ